MCVKKMQSERKIVDRVDGDGDFEGDYECEQRFECSFGYQRCFKVYVNFRSFIAIHGYKLDVFSLVEKVASILRN